MVNFGEAKRLPIEESVFFVDGTMGLLRKQFERQNKNEDIYERRRQRGNIVDGRQESAQEQPAGGNLWAD